MEHLIGIDEVRQATTNCINTLSSGKIQERLMLDIGEIVYDICHIFSNCSFVDYLFIHNTIITKMDSYE